MHIHMKHTLAVALLAVAAQASAQATFYENDGFQGRSFTTEHPVNNLQRFGFNDLLRSWSEANAGKCARTPRTVVAASSCARVSTRRWARWG
jgi:hypothetical protein